MRPTSLESKTLQFWLLLALSCGSSLTGRRGDSELARRLGMVRSYNSCHFLFLGHILSPLESVGNCCCLCIHLHWLALPDKRRQLSLVEGKTFVSTTSLIIWASLDSTSSSNSPYICAERGPSFFLVTSQSLRNRVMTASSSGSRDEGMSWAVRRSGRS